MAKEKAEREREGKRTASLILPLPLPLSPSLSLSPISPSFSLLSLPSPNARSCSVQEPLYDGYIQTYSKQYIPVLSYTATGLVSTLFSMFGYKWLSCIAISFPNDFDNPFCLQAPHRILLNVEGRRVFILVVPPLKWGLQILIVDFGLFSSPPTLMKAILIVGLYV